MTSAPTAPIDESVEEVVEASNFLPEMLQFWVVIAIGVLGAALISFVAVKVLQHVLMRLEVRRDTVNTLRMPLFGTLSFIMIKSAFAIFYAERSWYNPWQFALLAVMVFFLTWLLLRVVKVIEAVLLVRVEARFGSGRKLAKVRTQVGLLGRVIGAVLCILAIGAVLLSIEQVRALGAGILASAGLASVVVGLAVQPVLANVFAGLQIAFTDSIRVEDTVVVEQERGTIEEITLSYVVVLLLDGRRMILPSTYFTTTPFENWSRRSTEITGTVVFQLKLNAPIDYLRQRTTELLQSTDLWDGRSNSLNVTDVVGGLETVTILLSARNAGDLWELRNMLREKLLAELLESYPDCLPDPRTLPGTPLA